MGALNDKVALVTGSSGGIGAAIANPRGECGGLLQRARTDRAGERGVVLDVAGGAVMIRRRRRVLLPNRNARQRCTTRSSAA
jgi:hypothetical protein